MEIKEKIEKIKGELKKQGLDGWLLYDNHGTNRFAKELLGISPHLVLTRRFFYWIPQKGEPIKILHQIEAESLHFLPGTTFLYLSWHELEVVLQKILKKEKIIAMEYSPRNANPNVSVVDAGTIEVIRELDVEIVSSADLIQCFMSVLSEKQMESHLEAIVVLETTIERVWELIANKLRREQRVAEYDMQKFMLSEFTAQNCITEDGPICAVNGHTALPHYMARKHETREILKGDFILIDLWCKKDVSHSVYADLTRVAVASTEPTPKEEEIFTIVKEAQQKAIEHIRENVSTNRLTGADVDDVCRSFIQKKGYAKNFTHRTGHNIDTNVHGAGAHLDNLETADDRKILPGMCFSIEPGIYLPNEFGVRLESNLLVYPDGTVKISDKPEENILCLL